MSFLANPISFADVHVLLERLARRAETSPARKNPKKELVINFDVYSLSMSALDPFCACQWPAHPAINFLTNWLVKYLQNQPMCNPTRI